MLYCVFPIRCATTCLIVVLGYFYPSYLFLFQLLIALDISSHWIQMYSSLQHGETTHKVTDLAANPVMRFYYMRPVLFAFCAGNELFFSSLYILYFTSGPLSESLSKVFTTRVKEHLNHKILSYMNNGILKYVGLLQKAGVYKHVYMTCHFETVFISGYSHLMCSNGL